MIEIPGYEVLFENTTFGKKGQVVRSPNSQDLVHGTNILQISRFYASSEEDMIDLIVETARGFNSATLQFNMRGPLEVPLDYVLTRLPGDEIEKICKREEGIIKHLKEHYPGSPCQVDRAYFYAMNGTVSGELLNSEGAEQLIREHGDSMYAYLIDKVALDEWQLLIRLNAEDSFPESTELEYLLQRGVRDCDVFKATGNYGDYDTLANQVRLLYNIFSFPENVNLLPDNSELEIRAKAVKTILTTASCIAGRRMFGDLADQISKCLRGSEEQPKEDSFKGKFGGFDFGGKSWN